MGELSLSVISAGGVVRHVSCGEGEVTLEDALRSRANAPLERMLELAK